LDTEDVDSPFIINKTQKKSVGDAWKKHTSDKSTNAEPLVLTKGDFDEIRMWGNIED